MSYKLQKRLEEEQAAKTGLISLSQCLTKHANEVAAKAVEKGLKITKGKSMEEYEGVGTREVTEEVVKELEDPGKETKEAPANEL